MINNNRPRFKVITGGGRELEALHDKVMSLLDSREKQGIRELLNRNSDTCKKLLFPYIKTDSNLASLMTALTGILEAHARECYAIGYLDCIANRSHETKQDAIDP